MKEELILSKSGTVIISLHFELSSVFVEFSLLNTDKCLICTFKDYTSVHKSNNATQEYYYRGNKIDGLQF